MSREKKHVQLINLPPPPLSSLSTMIHTIVVTLVLSSYFSALEATGSSATSPSNISSCLLSNGVRNFSLPTSPSYTTLLNSSIQNPRFALPDVVKPVVVVLPGSQDDLQRAILCARNSSLAIRVRSGGHSYEGLSYTTENHVPFVVIDLMNLNRVQVDLGTSTVWAESGATLGELYYAIGQANRSLAFPAGSCSTVGLGGHIAGGGFGLLSRKFGLAADNVLDAILIDPNGEALTRGSMDEDVFWAIRGGGGGSWGVVYSWKLRLVPVPQIITAFTVDRTGPVKPVAELMHRWQYVAPDLPNEFYISVSISTTPSHGNLSMSFRVQVLGPKQHAMLVLRQQFPELGFTTSELSEMSWIESTAKFARLDSVTDLTNRQLNPYRQYAKSKSDYVKSLISLQDTTKIVQYLSTGPQGYIELSPYGGVMAQIGSSETPFPHRAGYLYSIQYHIYWEESDIARSEEYIRWLRSFYEYMTPFVSKDPRTTYVNYVDLDLGTNGWMNATDATSTNSVNHARSWGERYFMKNFNRLVLAKTKIDPRNVFNHAQSIPPLH